MQTLLQWKSSITYSQCLCVAFLYSMQCACAISSSVAFPLYNIFPRYLIKGTFFETKNVRFDFLYNFCGNTSQFQEELNDIRSQRYIGIHLTYLLFLSDFNKAWIFSTDFRKILKHKISSKSVQWKLSFPCGRKDTTKHFAILRRHLKRNKWKAHVMSHGKPSQCYRYNDRNETAIHN